MKNKNYTTTNKNGTLVFKITNGQFKDVEYVYESMMLKGEIKYKLKTKKALVNDKNKLLFESTIRDIIKDKLSNI